jgi:spore maturation protein CgeB
MKHGLDIAFFGSSLVSAYWNGAATYYRGVVRALAARGHRVTFYEPDAYDRQAHRDIDDPDWASVVVYDARTEGDALAALERARAADVIIKASGIGVFDDLLARAVLEVGRPATQKVFWDVDAPATLDAVQSESAHPFRELIPRYDHVFTYGGGDAVVRAYTALGARACVPIYNALDPNTHYPVAPDERFAADLAFMASRLPDREARVDAFFFEAARWAPERRFLLGGPGWENRALPPNVRYAGHVYTHAHNAWNCTPRAVLNVNRESMARYGFSPPTRIFEAAGAGACIITDDWSGIAAFLEPGREILIARDGAEVAEQLAALTPERARAIGAAAQLRMLAQHTYAHRVHEIERALGSRSIDKGETRGRRSHEGAGSDA